MMLPLSAAYALRPLAVYETPVWHSSCCLLLRMPTLKRFLALVMMLLPIIAFAQEWVNPHLRRDGTMVEGHLRTRPDVGGAFGP